MNVLLTNAGRRNYLVQFFQEVLGRRGQVMVCDSSDSAPALAQADRKFIVPPMDDPDYFDVLLSICREQRVRLLLSVHDLELSGLARLAPRFREVETIPVISSPKTIATCQDKWLAFHWLRACNISTPNTYLTLPDARQALSRREIQFPLLIKPRWGTSSIGVELIDNDRELELAHEWGRIQVKRSMLARMSQADPDNSVLIQERLEGQEYGMDVVNDLEAGFICTLQRRKLVMRAGTTDRAVTVSEPRLTQLGREISQRLGHIGSLDCDVIATEKALCVLDLNPRLGGGYPFSHLGGANLPAALIAWANEQQPDPSCFSVRSGVIASKYDGVAVIDRTVLPEIVCEELQTSIR